MNAAQIIQKLGMRSHPEGGHYVETFRDAVTHEGRSCSTAIYFLLQHGEISHWHRVDAVEIWHWHAGAPLALSISENGLQTQVISLGPDVLNEQHPQGIVPGHAWQSAKSLGDWTLVGCTVAPGFQFESFELAAPGWSPGL
ncbi:MAG: cupin domain-containing protein [Cohaesibacteraceae bacterium]|nr:cupin domain-containing protein [Cohaesibacteraceae bacterium]